MSNITVQFNAYHSAAGQIIQWGTQGTVGHASLVLPSGDLLDAQFQDGLGAQPSGVWIRPASYIAESGGYNIVRVSLPTTEECAAAAYDWARSMIGDGYDLRDILGIAANEDWSTPGKMICSGLVMGALTQPSPAFIGHKLAKDWRCWSPEEALLLCSAFAPVVPAEQVPV